MTRSRYDKANDEVRAPYPNNHPESRDTTDHERWSINEIGVTQVEWAYLGLRLATAIVKLTTQLQMAYSDLKDEYMKLMMTEYTNNLAKRIRDWEKDVACQLGNPSLIEIAMPLVKETNREELTEELAIKILQEKIVEESNRNWEPRATPTTIWNWTRKRKPLTEQCFSIDRWTPAIQHAGDVEKENMYWEWVKSQTPAEPPAAPKRRRLIRGEAILPIGETVVQQRAISNRFDGHLRGRMYYPSVISVLLANFAQLGIRSLRGYMGLRGLILWSRMLFGRLRRGRRRGLGNEGRGQRLSHLRSTNLGQWGYIPRDIVSDGGYSGVQSLWAFLFVSVTVDMRA